MQPQQPYAPPMPQFPQQQQVPQGYQYPPAPPVPQQYAPPAAYPQQGYPQQYAAPQPPAPPLPTGTLDGFFEQPSASGGPSFKFQDANRLPVIGKSYQGIVARAVTNADVRAQTDNNDRAVTYKDGRPKFVMIVPMLVQPSQEFPEGQAGWWVKGQGRDELARAMAEAGAPAGPPEAGAAIRVTLVGTRPVPGYNPQFLFRVEYVRPDGAAPAAPAQPAQAPEPQQTAPVVSTATGQPVVHQQPIPAFPQPQAAPQPVAMAAPQAAPEQAPAPAGFNPEQAALFAKLTGG